MNSADRALYLLKTRGALTAQALAAELGLTSMGARKQLQALEEKGLAETETQAQGVGRPVQLWRLSERGHGRFPDRHSDLTLQLLEQVRAVFGEAGLERLIQRREEQSEADYLRAMSGAEGLPQRLDALARIRSQEGYMAELQPDGAGWLLLENHCPICAAARQCQGLCRSELALFERVLGPAAAVERVEHALADGGRRCVYRIVPLPD
ncbi:helix-turn-helix transcriptional regulator [Chromobacterium aquaticum]|uniref:Helix-turn-helix transcriptional regulator n=1 Tax=Chromobacterium aquaticum TaxID=467180 RepID=A0ABV8ZVB8_9NEIS|nr:metalloregulator ArsR/SmtB family transcription factor [Chromobacterium aquaticum]MCD5363770.1 transcriptional regulator [Chromobacterium aquaticum]